MNPKKRLIVIGGGPAGLSAASEASLLGMEVTILEMSSELGGQYFFGKYEATSKGSPVYFRKSSEGVNVYIDTVVFDAPSDGEISIWNKTQGVKTLQYDALIITTGAYDRPVALPGWTLPGVLTAGGASRLAKAGQIAPGKRVLIAGSGPFLLSVADELARLECQIIIVEATPLKATMCGVKNILKVPGVFSQAANYILALFLKGASFNYRSIVTRIHGESHVQSVTISTVDEEWKPIPGTDRTIDVDAVCLGYGFVPHLEIAQLFKCPIGYRVNTSDFFVKTDKFLRTEHLGIYAAGETTGIGGMRKAVLEGEIAGITAAFDAGLIDSKKYSTRIGKIENKLSNYRQFSEWIRWAYRPRAGLWSLAEPSTIVCRCEDVRVKDLIEAAQVTASTPFAVKTVTRAGMGLCQGRICGSYMIEWLRAHNEYEVPSDIWPWRVRPPIWPVNYKDWLIDA